MYKRQVIDCYIFIDDLCGSGVQAVEYSTKVVDKIKAISPEVEVYYIPIFGTESGIDHVRKNTSFDRVDPVFSLDESFKVFSYDSRYFKNAPEGISKAYAKNTFLKHGRQICPAHPLGYEDGQQLIGFEHNVPDNTLPAIWFEDDNSSWVPIFKRYHKIG